MKPETGTELLVILDLDEDLVGAACTFLLVAKGFNHIFKASLANNLVIVWDHLTIFNELDDDRNVGLKVFVQCCSFGPTNFAKADIVGLAAFEVGDIAPAAGVRLYLNILERD